MFVYNVWTWPHFPRCGLGGRLWGKKQKREFGQCTVTSCQRFSSSGGSSDSIFTSLSLITRTPFLNAPFKYPPLLELWFILTTVIIETTFGEPRSHRHLSWRGRTLVSVYVCLEIPQEEDEMFVWCRTTDGCECWDGHETCEIQSEREETVSSRVNSEEIRSPHGPW